jgi:hypothetical protein
VCYRRNQVTLSPEPPGIFRFGLAPARAGRAGGPPESDRACRAAPSSPSFSASEKLARYGSSALSGVDHLRLKIPPHFVW